MQLQPCRALSDSEIENLYSPLDYDKNGNMIKGVDTALVYNWDNKLASAVSGANTISLKYDPAGNRIYKDSSEAGQRKYVVDTVGDLPTILLELDPVANYAIKKTYIYGNSQILAQHDGSCTAPKYFYLHDRLGSVRQIIDTSGDVVCRYTYNPFGELHATETEENLLNPFKYTGQYFDSETNLYYFRARMYDPHLGRFTNYDPIDGKFEEPLTLHKYLYCWNDPINLIDPLGLDAYLIYFPMGGPNWIEEILGENAGHAEVIVDTPDGKVMVGNAGYGDVYKPSVFNSLEKALENARKKYGDEVKVMRFKNKMLDWDDATSDQRIYEYINGRLAKDMMYPYCSRLSQQALSYGGYQLGLLYGLVPSWLWESAESSARYDDNVSLY